MLEGNCHFHFIAFSWHDIKYFNNQGYYHSDPYRLDNENI